MTTTKLIPIMVAELETAIAEIDSNPGEYALHQYGAIQRITLEWTRYRRDTMAAWVAAGEAPVADFNHAMAEGWTL